MNNRRDNTSPKFPLTYNRTGRRRIIVEKGKVARPENEDECEERRERGIKIMVRSVSEIRPPSGGLKAENMNSSSRVKKEVKNSDEYRRNVQREQEREQFFDEPDTNPVTGRTIKLGGATFWNLVEKYGPPPVLEDRKKSFMENGMINPWDNTRFSDRVDNLTMVREIKRVMKELKITKNDVWNFYKTVNVKAMTRKNGMADVSYRSETFMTSIARQFEKTTELPDDVIKLIISKVRKAEEEECRTWRCVIEYVHKDHREISGIIWFDDFKCNAKDVWHLVEDMVDINAYKKGDDGHTYTFQAISY